MLLALMLVAQAAPAVTPPPADAKSARPCKLADGRGRLRDYDPRICDGIIKAFSTPTQPAIARASTLLEFEVTEAGTVENCRIAEPSGTPELDAKACAITTEKARYAATPGSGKIKRQTKRLRVSWQVQN